MMQLFSKMNGKGYANLGEYCPHKAMSLCFKRKTAGQCGVLVRAENIK